MADSDGFESADEEKQPSTPGTPSPNEAAPPAVSVPETKPEPAAPPDSPDIKPDPVLTEKSPEKPAADDWGWGGWSSWAASSVSNVAGMASNATKGLSGALETFEASLGLPTPEELAKEMKESELKDTDETKAKDSNTENEQGTKY